MAGNQDYAVRQAEEAARAARANADRLGREQASGGGAARYQQAVRDADKAERNAAQVRRSNGY